MSAPTVEIKKVVVHPLVLLSVVDHFNRIRNQRRVVGVLLGSWRQGVLDVANCFAGEFNKSADHCIPRSPWVAHWDVS